MKKTRFNELHKLSGGKMIEFVGWEMPVEYSGIIPEHLAVRTKAGLFDVSHMGEVTVKGKGALSFLQWLTPNDVARLSPGQVQYTALTTAEGTFVDDMLIYCMGRGTISWSSTPPTPTRTSPGSPGTRPVSRSRSRTSATPGPSSPSRARKPRGSSAP
jgi:glycine cleavage system aminomethyltransferase T